MPHSGPAPAPRTTRRLGRGRLLRIAVACAVLLAITAYLAVRTVTDQSGARCVVRGAPDGADGERGHTYELKPDQAANAATIAAVASQRGLPERAVTIALATAIQESALRNIGHGDRDSVGLFQQRPSQGWGTADQIQDPVYSAAKFYDHLAKIPGYSRLPLTVAAQQVQRSGYPQAYAKHEANAALLTAALTGRNAAAFNCTTGPGDKDERGDAERVRAQLVREFGKDVLAEGRGTLSTASAAASGTTREAGAAATRGPAGRALTVPAHGEREGWELAHWAVANASGLRIDRIAYAGRVWSAGRSDEGWRAEPDEGAHQDAKGAQGSGERGPEDRVALRLAAGR